MKHNTFHSIFSLLLSIVIAISICVPIHAADIQEESPETTEPEVVQILIVSDDGCYLYEGAEAQTAYNQMAEGSFVHDAANLIASEPVSNMRTPSPSTLGDFDVEPAGAFSYKYRFVPATGSGEKTYGSYSIISDPWGNNTNVAQSSTIAFSSSASGSINSGVTGKYLDALQSSIGTQYTESFSATVSVSYNVPSYKRVWLQYKPEYTHYFGDVQKYYKPRYNSDLIIVESKIAVDVLEASQRTFTMSGKVLTLPAGTYTWCQDSDYMSHNPPTIQN